MRKAILSRFTIVVLLALILSSTISYYAMAKQFLQQNISRLTNLSNVIDHAVSYEGDIQMQIASLCDAMEDAIRVTILDKEGTVCADTKKVNIESMENHVQREEVQLALKKGVGTATRYSETLGENMLYVAQLAGDGVHIIRLSIPFTGWKIYMSTIFPMLFGGIIVSFSIAIFIGIKFTNTITEPLYEIADEMQKVHSNKFDFSFKHYRYKELNTISNATMKLSGETGEHIRQIENERKIRQKFFSNASHELKTPITAIRGYAELLDNGFAQDEETRKNFLRRILKTTDNMTELIDDILMISRLEAKEAEVTFSQVRMYPLLEEIFESLEPMAADYEVTLHLECGPISIEASAKQLRELLANLIGNGIKYNRPGGNVWVKVIQQGKDMIVAVKDDGSGISQEHQKRIFERFYRVDRGRSKKMGGTGLGLSIVKHIVEFYNGKIELNSEPGKGSEFLVVISMERAENIDNSVSLH